MILEAVELNIKNGEAKEFQKAFSKAQEIITSIKGYRSHQLQRCIENKNSYLFLVQWENLEAHTINFRESDKYQQWKKLLHHFYEPFPEVKHYEMVYNNSVEHRTKL